LVHCELAFSLIDSFPLSASRFAMVYRCGRLARESSFGYNGMNKQAFHRLTPTGVAGFRTIVVVSTSSSRERPWLSVALSSAER